MVGWRPLDPTLRKIKVEGFLRRVAESQDFGAKDVPLVLQYNSSLGDLRPWLWPLKNGIPVRPDELDQHRYKYYFKGPCCLCPYENEASSFSEAKIGLAQTVSQPGTAQCFGQYVAVCATQQCGYLVRLERYYGHPLLPAYAYEKREKPLKTIDPFIFLTDDTEESIKRTGFRQIEVLRDDSNTGLRGTNRLLRREDPEQFLELQGLLKKLIVRGLPAESFWDMFIQCTKCKYVMPRQFFPYYHPCMVQVVHRQLGLPKNIRPTETFEETIDRILTEDDGEDELPERLSVFAPTSKLGDLPLVDPYADITLSPKRHPSSRRA